MPISRTRLAQSAVISKVWIRLIDCWTSLEHFERFKVQHLADYEQLDLRCAALTESETCWGSFALLPHVAG